MAVESLIGLSLFTLAMLVIAWYADKHRTDERGKRSS